MTQEELQYCLDRYRRRFIHLVKPATNEAMEKLDEEIYYSKTQETQQ